MLQQIKHGYISRVYLSLASVWHFYLQNCYSWSCKQMISLLFIAAGAATAFWLELYSLGPWFLYISLDGAMRLRWDASPPVNVFCYTISYIVHYHYYFHKSISVGSFLLLLGIVPATICILFAWHPKKVLEVNLDWVGFYNSWCPSGCARTERLAFQAGLTFILIHILLTYSARSPYPKIQYGNLGSCFQCAYASITFSKIRCLPPARNWELPGSLHSGGTKWCSSCRNQQPRNPALMGPTCPLPTDSVCVWISQSSIEVRCFC